MSEKWTKYKTTMVKNLGSEEAYKEFIRRRGSKGGSKPVLKGWGKRRADKVAGKTVRVITK